MSNYSTLLADHNWTILAEETFGSHQGDYAIAMVRNGVYAFTVIGYGSCSGCDLYERRVPYVGYWINYDPWTGKPDPDDLARAEQQLADRTVARNDLADELEQTIDFLGSADEVVKYIGSEMRDALDWYRHEPDFIRAQDNLQMAVLTHVRNARKS